MTGVRVLPAAGHAQAAAAAIADAVERAARKDGPVSIALAGGSTPREVHACWAAQLADDPGLRARLRFYFGDERGVDRADPESNFRMAAESLFHPAGIRPEQVFRMEADRLDREVAALNYEHVLPDPVDVLLLGIGDDGHCASIFPGAKGLVETKRRVLPADSPAGVRARMTITPRVIASAKTVIVLAKGRSKAEAVRRALSSDTDALACPALLARRGLWILDEAAAGLLDGPVP